MGSHAAPKSHMASAIIFGLVLVVLVYFIFGFLSGNYSMMLPLLVVYAVWAIASLFIFGKGLDREAAAEGADQH